MPKTVLVIDDNAINRQMLRRILSSDYSVAEAENGRDALAYLMRKHQVVSAVLLDIIMPEMDGYQLLEKMQANTLLSQIPVIVMTGNAEPDSEKKALALGANDFVAKPYDSDIIRRRLQNLIRLRETSAMVNTLQRDKLTGLWNRETFFEKAAWEIAQRPEGSFVLACVDIDNFKVINDRYGTEKGDSVLRSLADALQKSCDTYGGICGRISADNFIALYPLRLLKDGVVEPKRIEDAMRRENSLSVVLSVGRYIVDDKGLSVSAMYDRAKIAQVTVKGRYDVHAALYEESMRASILREQEIINEMYAALKSGQFEAWFQPQYNHSNGALVGAEALARWRHPLRGLVPPGEFIPVFERNGFVYELDKFIWEQACICLRRWLDEERNPLPVSVNVSRYDLFRDDLMEVLTDVTEKYDIPVPLLRLEITESAFAESTARVVSVVKRLIGHGFTVEIDDFGSGYSSLNSLKDVPAQVLKLDMRFLETQTCSVDGSCVESSSRGGNILESIVRMAKWLGMSVIAEGVETVEQADFLESIGCSYVQGFLYARPMPLADYEALARRAGKEERLSAMVAVKNLDNNSFWDPSSMDTMIFNSYIGGACIFEWRGRRIEVLRVNEKYARSIGGEGCTAEDALKIVWEEHMEPPAARAVKEAIESAISTGDEVTCEAEYFGLPGRPGKTHLRTTFRAIARTSDRSLMYATNENITAQREADRKVRALNGNLQSMIDDMPGGYCRIRVEDDGRLRMDYVNDGICRIRGMSKTEIMEMAGDDAMAAIHEDDVGSMREAVRDMISTGETRRVIYRVRGRGGEYVRVQVLGRTTRDLNGSLMLNVYYTDLTEQEKKELSVRDTIPYVLSAIMKYSTDLVFAKDREFRYICCSPAFVKFTRQRSEADVIGRTDYDFWTKEEADRFRSDDLRLMESGKPLESYVEPIPSDDGIQHYCRTSKYILRGSEGEVVGLYGIGRDITEERTAYEQLKLLTDSISGGLLTYATSPEGIKVTYFNDGICRLLGCTREEYELATEKSVITSVFDEDVPRLQAQIAAMVRDGTPVDCTYRLHNMKDSGYKWVNLRVAPAEWIGGERFANAVLYDVTEQRAVAEALRVSEAEYRLAIERSGKLIYRFSHADSSIELPENTAKLFGLPSRVEDVPESIIATGAVAPESVEDFREFYRAILRGDKTGGMTIRRKTAGGEWRWFTATFSTVYGDRGIPVSAIVMFEDITREREEHIAIEDKLRLAELDGMTGIYNKTTTEELIARKLQKERNAGALLIADLDDLKGINDNLGHDQGDNAIKLMAGLLRSHFRQTDIVGRVGGDEFAVYLGKITRTQVSATLSSLMEKLDQLRIGEHDDVELRGSIGVAICGPGDSYAELFKKADKALYQAKRGGKHRYAFYTPEMEEV